MKTIEDADGYTRREVLVVRMLDNDESAPWFTRQHEELGTVTHPFDGPVPYDETELLAFVRREFGDDACALY